MGKGWVVARLFPVSTSDGHGQGLEWWQGSSLSPPLTVMGKGLGRGKALPCPLGNVVRPFLSLPASSSSTLNCTLDGGLRQATVFRAHGFPDIDAADKSWTQRPNERQQMDR